MAGGRVHQQWSASRGVEIPLETIKHGNRMDPQERAFLDAVEKGDLPSVARWLSGTPDRCPVSVNCTDMLGRSAIQIAVDNENIELVELLLKQEGVKIGDALLYAIREGVYRIVEMLIEHPSITRAMLGSEWARARHVDDESFDYSPDISPVILAAYCNQFEILQLLLVHGATIDRPHPLSCPCRRCRVKVHADGLRHSLLRINTYRALASPAWISLTSLDPILTAFRLSWELDHLALRENEFKDSYSQLSQQCKKYACDLLQQCRSSEEVIAVLNKNSETEEADVDDRSLGGDNAENVEKLTLARLKLALKYEQKQFVAHPHCQQLLTSIWYEGLPGWRKRNGFMKFLTCIGLILLLPFISLFYLIFPRSKIGQMLRSPFMKFLYHSASFGVFLFLLVCASTDIISNSPKRERFRGPEPSELEWLIVLWVTGFVWAECKQLWDEGLKAYIRQWWNWLDFIMLSLYLCTFSLRLVAYFQIESGRYGPREMLREDWPQSDPTIISEGLFAIANVFSFARIIYLFQANQYLGPLQISLGCMLIDIAKFLFIFFLVVSSFACGLNQLYWYYTDSDPDDEDLFFTLFSSYVTLFWSMFSLTAPQKLDVRSTQTFTRTVGELMFMAYHGMAIIVLLNMLIAMMSSSFQEIENHADMEWKFARSKLWMGYFDEGSTLPAPFNMIISPKSVYYLALWIKRVILDKICRKEMRYSLRRRKSSQSQVPVRARKTQGPHEVNIFTTKLSSETLNNNRPVNNGRASTSQEESHPIEVPPPQNNVNKQYQEVMRRLICRYIHHTKKEMRQSGVNADDLLEIKQDISSLRFELREDRKREVIRTTGHMDSLRRDLNQSIARLSPIPSSIGTTPLVSPAPYFENHAPSQTSLLSSHMDSKFSRAQLDLHIGHSSTHTISNPNFLAPPVFDGRSSYSLATHSSFDGEASDVRHLHSSLDFDCLKAEIVAGIRHEIRDALHQTLSVGSKQTIQASGHANPAPGSGAISLPPTSSDLYHTHLYTQL